MPRPRRAEVAPSSLPDDLVKPHELFARHAGATLFQKRGRNAGLTKQLINRVRRQRARGAHQQILNK